MIVKNYSVNIYIESLPIIKEALTYANKFLITSAGQRNRNFARDKVFFTDKISFAMQEVLFDPQTSGGLLISVSPKESKFLVEALQKADIDACIVGKVTSFNKYKVNVM